MGTVNFNTEVTKNVNLDKDVTLDVVKNVNSNVNINGNLATAEASADAVGTGAGEGTDDFTFVIDTFDNVPAQEVIGGETDTRVPFESDIPNGQATVTVTTLAGADEQNVSRANSPEGSSVGQFSSEVTASADFSLEYTSLDGAFELLPDGRDPEDCIVTIDMVINDVGTLPDGSPAPFTPLFITLTDADGDQATVNLAIPSIAPPGEDVELSLGLFTGATAEDPADPLPDAPNADLDFSTITSILAQVPGEFDFDGDGTGEIVTATDLQVDNIEIFCPGQQAAGNLAETDTFAQVTDTGAFSFSESLAASSSSAGGDTDMMIG